MSQYGGSTDGGSIGATLKPGMQHQTDMVGRVAFLIQTLRQARNNTELVERRIRMYSEEVVRLADQKKAMAAEVSQYQAELNDLGVTLDLTKLA